MYHKVNYFYFHPPLYDVEKFAKKKKKKKKKKKNKKKKNNNKKKNKIKIK